LSLAREREREREVENDDSTKLRKIFVEVKFVAQEKNKQQEWGKRK